MTLLELDEVHAQYGPSEILRGLTMEVEEGEIVTLLGRNGAGKTTTVRSIAGAKPPEVTAGQIRFDGDDITEWRADDITMAGVGVVPEERRLFGELTVEENLHMSKVTQNNWNTARRRVKKQNGNSMPLSDIYDLFPVLEERRGQKSRTLSGGEQQMLSIARTLRLPNNKVLLLDEPSEGLAPKIVQAVADSIREIADRGMTVLLIEQNVRVALELAERGYVLDQGKIVYEGTTAEIRDADLDEYLVL